jgi:hypothetical protein
MLNLIKTLAILSVATAAATLGSEAVIKRLETKPAEASGHTVIQPGKTSCKELDERGVSRYWTNPRTGERIQICYEGIVSNPVKCEEMEERGISKDWTDNRTGKRSRYCQ